MTGLLEALEHLAQAIVEEPAGGLAAPVPQKAAEKPETAAVAPLVDALAEYALSLRESEDGEGK